MSGVANVSKDIILGTCKEFNWIQLGCYPSANNKNSILKEGQIINFSEQYSDKLKIDDLYIYSCISSNYGSVQKIQNLLTVFRTETEEHKRVVQVDAILHFTDPRYWTWLYKEQRAIRQQIPILYYNVWDNLPYPQYNKAYYQSCDWIFNMSKQSENVVKTVCQDNKVNTTYIPLGINSNDYRPLRNSDNQKLQLYRKLYGANKMQFIILYINRNIVRKHPSDVLLGFKIFVDNLPIQKQSKVSLIMKTDIIDNAGTDLNALYNDLLGNKYNVKFIPDRVNRQGLNVLYNIADVTVSLSSAQGFGLTTAESLMAGTPIIATVTGGLQDQMRFTDQNNELIEFTYNFPTNSYGKYKNHGSWVYPLYTDSQVTAGSPETPYIWQSYTDYNKLGETLLHVYNTTTKEERRKKGLLGRQWLLTEQCGMNMQSMSKGFINGITEAINAYVPRQRYQIIKHTNIDLEYKGIYNRLKDEWS